MCAEDGQRDLECARRDPSSFVEIDAEDERDAVESAAIELVAKREPVSLSLAVRATTSNHSASSKEMLFDVTVTNTSAEPVLACAEDWLHQTGIIYLKVFDESGHELIPSDGLHADFGVTEDKNLVLLRPGEHISGQVDLLIGGAKYPLNPGRYRVVAGYYCPFDGFREMSGVLAKIAGAPQVSQWIWIAVSR